MKCHKIIQFAVLSALALPIFGTARAYTAVTTPNGSTLPYVMDRGAKVFHLVAEPVKKEIAPGMVINAWGYNGQSPGPTIEAVEGDRVRILVTNKLPEATSLHWHGVLLPSGMDGVSGLNQPKIEPGETYAYEFTLRQHGTQMYHPHADETTQMALGMQGFFIIHPKREAKPIDRDFAIFLHEWDVPPSAATPNPATMTDFNLFTFNGRAYPGTAPLVVKKGQRVRIRLANLSMDSHPPPRIPLCRDWNGWGRNSGASTAPGNNGECSNRHDARHRVCRECRGGLVLPLPQEPPHDESDVSFDP